MSLFLKINNQKLNNLIIKRKKILCENMINQLQHNIEIEKIESLIKLDESVYNTYNLYNNNFINEKKIWKRL